MSGVGMAGRDDDGDDDGPRWFGFLSNVSANFNVLESAFDVENQFLMNVWTSFIVFDVLIDIKILFCWMSEMIYLFLIL